MRGDSHISERQNMTIQPTTQADLAALAAIADATLFPGEYLADMIAPALAGDTDDLWLNAFDGDTPIGFCFAVREAFTEATWNMRALAVDPAHHRHGHGAALVASLEARLRDLVAVTLVIDTASDPSQTAARAFYPANGYKPAGVIPSFWEAGNDKVAFFKDLSG